MREEIGERAGALSRRRCFGVSHGRQEVGDLAEAIGGPGNTNAMAKGIELAQKIGRFEVSARNLRHYPEVEAGDDAVDGAVRLAFIKEEE